jgi:hypothetical protein
MATTPTKAGIDASKIRLDAPIRPNGGCRGVAGAEHGTECVDARLREVRPSLVARESTGGLGRSLAAGLVVGSLGKCRGFDPEGSLASKR